MLLGEENGSEQDSKEEIQTSLLAFGLLNRIHYFSQRRKSVSLLSTGVKNSVFSPVGCKGPLGAEPGLSDGSSVMV